MTLDDYEKLEKTATPGDWNPDNVNMEIRGPEFNGYYSALVPESEADLKFISVSRNVSKELIALVRAVQHQRDAIGCGLRLTIFNALAAVEKKLGEQ